MDASNLFLGGDGSRRRHRRHPSLVGGTDLGQEDQAWLVGARAAAEVLLRLRIAEWEEARRGS